MRVSHVMFADDIPQSKGAPFALPIKHSVLLACSSVLRPWTVAVPSGLAEALGDVFWLSYETIDGSGMDPTGGWKSDVSGGFREGSLQTIRGRRPWTVDSGSWMLDPGPLALL